jgi:hypothetical protein
MEDEISEKGGEDCQDRTATPAERRQMQNPTRDKTRDKTRDRRWMGWPHWMEGMASTNPTWAAAGAAVLWSPPA